MQNLIFVIDLIAVNINSILYRRKFDWISYIKAIEMTPSQTAFLESIAKRIPALMEAIRLGNQRSEFILGRRHINGRQVRLILLAEVVDAGANPLATHSSRSSENDDPGHDPGHDTGHSQIADQLKSNPE